MVTLWIKVAGTAFVTLAVNLPFGYWRADVRKFSKAWFLAVHLPVPLVLATRLGMKLPFKFVPIFVAAFFSGQWLGARWKRALLSRGIQSSSCLVLDILRGRALNI